MGEDATLDIPKSPSFTIGSSPARPPLYAGGSVSNRKAYRPSGRGAGVYSKTMLKVMPEENICQLEVTVENFSVMNVLDGTTELDEPLPYGLLSNQALARPCELDTRL